jgi:hypothetical protein
LSVDGRPENKNKNSCVGPIGFNNNKSIKSGYCKIYTDGKAESGLLRDVRGKGG